MKKLLKTAVMILGALAIASLFAAIATAFTPELRTARLYIGWAIAGVAIILIIWAIVIEFRDLIEEFKR